MNALAPHNKKWVGGAAKCWRGRPCVKKLNGSTKAKGAALAYFVCFVCMLECGFVCWLVGWRWRRSLTSPSKHGMERGSWHGMWSECGRYAGPVMGPPPDWPLSLIHLLSALHERVSLWTPLLTNNLSLSLSLASTKLITRHLPPCLTYMLSSRCPMPMLDEWEVLLCATTIPSGMGKQWIREKIWKNEC